jgi:ABC-type uncharacterized transport system YnjBCD permease subunit
MNLEDGQIKELADEQGVDAAALHELLATLYAQAGADYFYVFWTAGKVAGAPGARRRRTLLAFLTPDAALAFAQRNQLNVADRPRLRRLTLFQFLQAMLREPAITAILFVADHDDQMLPAGRMPPGVRIERAHMLRSLHPDP